MKYKAIVILFLVLISSTFTGCTTIQRIAEFNLDHLTVEKEVVEIEYEKLPESTYVKDTIELSMDNGKTLNPLDGVAYNVDQGLKLVYEGLFVPDAYYAIEPVLVSTYEQINDTTYRLTLKEHVQFHSGEALKAEDVVYSYNYILLQLNSGYRYVNTYIQSISAEDDQTLLVEFKKKDRYNLYALTFPIISKAYLESATYNPTLPIGTGPYQYEKFQNMIELVLKKNVDYHGELANVEKVRFTFVREFEEQYNMFVSKRIDLIAPVLTEWSNYSDDQSIHKKLFLSPYYYYIGFNHSRALLQDVNMRRYFMNAMDYKTIGRDIFLNHLFFTPLPTHLESDIQGQLASFDLTPKDTVQMPATAQTQPYRFIYLLEDENQRKIADTFEQSIDAIDDGKMDILFEGLARQDYEAALKEGDFDMYLNVYQTSLVPSLTQVLGSNGTHNYGKYTNPNLDGLLVSYRQVETDEQYVNQLNALGEIIMSELPIIPIGFVENGMFIHDKIDGLFTPNYFHLYKNIQDIKITDQ